MKLTKQEWLIIVTMVVITRISLYLFNGDILMSIIASVLLGPVLIKILKKIIK